jgi:Fe-S-cluster containining protein
MCLSNVVRPLLVISQAATHLKAEKLARAARKSLGSYCHTECLAYCCRGGYLLLSEEEVGLMRNTKREALRMMPLRSKNDAVRYIFNLGRRPEGCPNLRAYKCVIHKNPKRPNACKDFPLFIFKKTIIVTDECPAVNENKLYPYLAKFKALGFTIIYSSDRK